MIEVANLLEDPALAAQKKESNVTVIVAGSRFCIVPSLWKKVQALPWLTDVQGFPQLVHANPDVFELLRGKTAFVRSSAFSLQSITNNMSSGYFRDYQMLKEAYLPMFSTIKECLLVAIETVRARIATVDDRPPDSVKKQFGFPQPSKYQQYAQLSTDTLKEAATGASRTVQDSAA